MLIYVASPYSHVDKDREHLRYVKVESYVAFKFQREPELVRLSPIVYWHNAAVKLSLATTAEHYKTFNRRLMESCDAVEVLMIEGYNDSKGVLMELGWAEELNLITRFVDPAKLTY